MAQKRNTLQKQQIQTVFDNVHSFFTAEDLHALILKKHSSIGIATVYRFLNELKYEGKVYSYVCDRKQLYSKQAKSHCHFICEKTGKVIHFTVDSLDFLKNKVPGTITSFQLEVRGVCKDDCKKCGK